MPSQLHTKIQSCTDISVMPVQLFFHISKASLLFCLVSSSLFSTFTPAYVSIIPAGNMLIPPIKVKENAQIPKRMHTIHKIISAMTTHIPDLELSISLRVGRVGLAVLLSVGLIGGTGFRNAKLSSK